MFDVVVADCPWKFNARNNLETSFGKGTPYSTMSFEEIYSLGALINEIVSENCILFLWTTNAKDKQCKKVFDEWGFRLVTKGFTYIKMSKDGKPLAKIGSQTGSNSEDCWIGIRGTMHPEQKLVNQVILSPLLRHSEKPEEAQDRIELMYPPGKYKHLELFARRKRKNWICLGNEISGRDICEDLTILSSANAHN